MLKRAAFISMLASTLACLSLAACQPKAPEAPAVEPTPEQAQAPAAPAGAALAADEIAAPAGEITATSPAPGAKLTSPITVEGTVINTWMFEGVFPVELAVDGEVVTAAPAQQQAPDNWTNPGPVKFKATIEFTVTEEKSAVLILKEDMPKPKSPDSDEPGPARTLRIPVTLAPSAN
jgi:immunoglobulin-like protein involved in spore germination